MSTETASHEPSATFPRLYNEMRTRTGIAPAYLQLDEWLKTAKADSLQRLQRSSDELFSRRGITFAVYGDPHGSRRLIPFDLIPRALTASEWKLVADGCVQRVRALNAFLSDIYDEQEICKAGVIPTEEIARNKLYSQAAIGVKLPYGVHSHVSGVDVVRIASDHWCVLEDNLRTPSGVSYMLENRRAMRRFCPELFNRQRILPIDHYPDLLMEALSDCAPPTDRKPSVAVLTPGPINSAFFEHSYLAQRMGAELVEGQDLYCDKGKLWMRTLTGPQVIDVLYRRIDDDYLDPKVFRSDSVLGVPGLIDVYRSGGVTLANAVGNGVADDKSIYPRVPEMIRFYLGEEPILKNVHTYRLGEESDRQYVLEHLAELVVKEVHGSGGYGMLIGPTSTVAERTAYKARILSDPSAFIAQPTLALSTCPTFVAQGIAPRHVDLRPYVVSGKTVSVVPGGLTSVALKEGSLVVNSSQGGGTKDTWVIADG